MPPFALVTGKKLHLYSTPVGLEEENGKCVNVMCLQSGEMVALIPIVWMLSAFPAITNTLLVVLNFTSLSIC